MIQRKFNNSSFEQNNTVQGYDMTYRKHLNIQTANLSFNGKKFKSTNAISMVYRCS